MATLPPPPPYSQRDAVQAQRYYRRSLRRPSMLGPVVLIVVGVIALLVETGKLNAFHLWDWYIRWWPLLLIGVGLLSLGEWWLDGQRGNIGRRSHGGLVALIICLAILGYVISRTSHLRGMHLFGHGVDEDDVFSHLFGQEHDADHNLNRPIPAGAFVDIQVPHGDVTVTPSGDDQIHVQSHQVVYASNDRDARRNLDALAPQLTVNGKNVTLRAADGNDGRADLTIEIPNGAVPTVTSGHGDVTLEGLTGDATVAAIRGDVKVDNLNGGLQVRMSKGEFSAHAITGGLTLQGRLDDVSISDVQGKVALDGDFFGDTDLAHIAAPVHFHSSRTDVEVASIPGDLAIDSGDLQLNNATGPARISTSAKDVECTGIAGDLHVEDGDGDISVGAIVPLGQLQIHNRNGAIHLTVPQGAGFQLQATARNGNIDSKLDLPVSSAGEGQSITGKVGKGGPSVELVADHGDIEITNMEPPEPPEPPTPPSSPAPPAPPAPPGNKTMRHLRPSKGSTGDAETSGQPVVQ
jgi:DUF4097 and DUF4098 domain-containing protein YvlB